MMKTIILHGVLGEKFGKEYILNIDTIREATHALSCQLDGFRKYMIDSEREGIKFAVFSDEIVQARNVSEDNIDNKTGAKIIHIVPKIMGAGGSGGVWQLISGAVLVGVGLAMGGNPYLIAMGASMALGGITSMLMPTPKVEGKDPDGNRPSNGFGGAVTTVAQGNIVPVLYGQRMIGGFVISGSRMAENKT